MLNVQLLRKTQESILDRHQPFDMRDWCHCIAGHLIRLAAAEGIPVPTPEALRVLSISALVASTADLAGLPYGEAYELFIETHFAYYDRHSAARAIDRLIERLGPDEDEAQGLRGKAPSRSPRANTEANTEEKALSVQDFDWTPTISIPLFSVHRLRERQDIERILAQAEREAEAKELVAV